MTGAILALLLAAKPIPACADIEGKLYAEMDERVVAWTVGFPGRRFQVDPGIRVGRWDCIGPKKDMKLKVIFTRGPKPDTWELLAWVVETDR